MSLVLDYYKTLFLSVHTQIVQGKKKVAKPLFLISLIDFIECGLLTTNQINYTIELEQYYNGQFERYGIPLSPMKYPFYHLTSDGFYHIKGNLTSKSPTPKQLREKVDYAYFDDELWALLQDQDTRNELRTALIDHFINND